MEILNLHGFKYLEARNATIRKIESLWGTKNTLQIITGDSQGMKNTVIEVLDEYKLDYTDGDLYNRGYIKTEI